MKNITLHLEMSDEDAEGLLDEAMDLAASDEVTKMALALQPTYTSYQAKVLAVGSVPA